MAPRKKVKGKKPEETMRQRQQRLLREQRAAKARAKSVKTNPTGAPRGAQGPARPPVQGPSRPTPRTIGGDTGRRGGVNKYGTAGTPKSGPPGVGKPPRFDPSIRTASKLAKGLKGLGAAGLAISGIATAKDLADSLKRGEGFAKLARKGTTQGKGTKGGQGGSRAAVKRKPKPETKPKRKVTSRNRRGRPTSFAKPVKPAKRGMSNIPPQEGTGKGSPNDKKPAKRQNAAPKPKPKTTPKPKVKKGGGVTGVGPVASGRAYSVAKTGKSVAQQNVESLKKMGTKSERFKKLATEAKKKSLERGKKNRERNKVRRGGRR